MPADMFIFLMNCRICADRAFAAFAFMGTIENKILRFEKNIAIDVTVFFDINDQQFYRYAAFC